MSKNHVISYLLIAPAAIYMLLLVGYPLIYNMILSFQNMDLSTLNSGEVLFVGFENYRAIFQEEAFHIALRNTLVYTFLSIVFQFIVGFLLALFFAKKFKGSDGLRGFVMIAWLIPQTITAYLRLC